MKKTLCVIIAVIIALSSFAVVSFADAPAISMSADKTNAKVGDIVTVTVRVAKGSNLCSATLDLVYDNSFFKIVSIEATETMGGFVNKDFAPNKARYTAVVEDRLRDEGDLFTAKFEVLKRGGKISLEANEVYYIASDMKRTNVTSGVNEDLKDEVVTIVCPHTEKTTTTTNSTCSKEGKKVEICKECGFKSETPIAKLPHSGDEVVVIKAATCAEAGKQGKKCQVCGQTFDEKEIEKLPHDLKETVIKEATCTETGKTAKKCKNCGYTTDEKEIAKLPHDMEDVVIKQATCTEAGKTAKKCKNCDYTTDEKEIEKLPHDMKQVVTKEATCEETGKMHEECKVCGLKGEEKDIPAKGHVAGKWETVKVPTKTEAGLEQKKCTVCGHVMESREIPAAVSYKLGDVNEDGHVTAVDARMVLQNVAELNELTIAQRLAADTNGDGKVTAVDARLILQYVAGLVKF